LLDSTTGQGVNGRFNPVEFDNYVSLSTRILRVAAEIKLKSTFSDQIRKHAISLVRDFLSKYEHGLAYADMLQYVAQIILGYGITQADIGTDNKSISGDNAAERGLIKWVLRLSNQHDVSVLSDNCLDLCIMSDRWLEILLQGLERYPETASVSDDQILGLTRSNIYENIAIRLISLLRRRGNEGYARQLICEGRISKKTTDYNIQFILMMRSLEVLSSTSVNLENVLLTLNPADVKIHDAAPAFQMARELNMRDAILLAGWRYVNNDEFKPGDVDSEVLAQVLIEAWLKLGQKGYAPAIDLYRRFNPGLDRILYMLPQLMKCARHLNCDDITTQICSFINPEEISSSDLDWLELKGTSLEFKGQLDEAFVIWRKLEEASPADATNLNRIIENRLSKNRRQESQDYIDKLIKLDQPDAKMLGYSYAAILQKGWSSENVINIVRSHPEILDTNNPLYRRVSDIYIYELAKSRRWPELQEFLTRHKNANFRLKNFYLPLSTIMCFANSPRSERSAVDNLESILSTARSLASTYMTVEQCIMLLDLNLVDMIRVLVPQNVARIDYLMGQLEAELEIRIALEAEALIQRLEQKGIETNEFRRMLRSMELKHGALQLMKELERAYRTLGG
jgi:hypothetical protein